jgi:uncharacterized membrane protein YccC
MTVDDLIFDAIKAKEVYLNEIYKKYRDKEPTTVAYKLSRKKAFLAMGELNTAFQRMTQEPKSRQKYFNELYKIVVLTNTFLSSLAAFGTFVRNHRNAEFSEDTEVLVRIIKNKLQKSTIRLKDLKQEDTCNERVVSGFEKDEKLPSDVSKDSRLVLEQLSYLANLSQNICHRIDIYQTQKNTGSKKDEQNVS